jgi:TIR domain
MGKIFLSYSRKDGAHLADLRRHAHRLEESKLVELWHDEAVLPGQAWADSIRRNLDDSRLVLALVSPDFLQSEWCLAELGRAFELRDRRLIDVVPIIVRQCAWRETQLGAIQALPAGGAPIESYPDPQAGWREVVEGPMRRRCNRQPVATQNGSLPPPSKRGRDGWAVCRNSWRTGRSTACCLIG